MRAGIRRSQERRRAAKALAPLLRKPMFQSPGATVACAKPRARWNHSTQGARMEPGGR